MYLLYSSEPTEEQWTERNTIVTEANKKGYVTRQQAAFLLKFDEKYRRCNSCERSFREVGGWMLATAPDKRGRDLEVGLMDRCIECMLKGIHAEDDAGNL